MNSNGVIDMEDLYARWPKILAQDGRKVGLPIEQGWKILIDELCKQLQHYTDHEGEPQVKARQIKEKLGGLRFYAGPASATQHALIRFAEALSYRACQTCGGMGQLYNKDGWYSTKCLAHAPKGGRPAAPADASVRITVLRPTSDEAKDKPDGVGF
jgi:hypothetical protein